MPRPRSHKARGTRGPDKRSTRKWPTAIDLFSGSGAASAALKESHFRVVAAVDNDPTACATYRLNHPHVRLYETDILALTPDIIKRECLKGISLDLMVICAPCQPFSSQNRKRERDPRARLLIEGARFVAALKPKVVFVENVPGLASSTNADLLIEFHEKCGQGYVFSEPMRVDAANYGVPQRRIRCLLMASRGGAVPVLPAPITPAGQRLTVRDAIYDLRPLTSGEIDPDDRLHVARSHRQVAIDRLRSIPKDGGSRSDLPRSLELDCHKDQKGFPDVYGRMKWDDVAPTLTTGCTDVTRGRFAHPEDDRAITPREAALLQTFPRGYQFAGAPQVVAEQIGNAIPFALVKTLAPAFRASINKWSG